MWRWLRRWLGSEEEPLEEIVGGLSDPEAEMWAEALRNEGMPVVIKSASPLLGQGGARTASDFSLHVRAGDAARARDALSPLLKAHADPSRLRQGRIRLRREPRRFRRRRRGRH